MNQTCDICGRSFPKTTQYFKKYSHKIDGKNFHTTCKECEKKKEIETEWKNGKLLCHVCGRYLDPSESMTHVLDQGRVYSNVSIDQIEPSKGYTLDNIQLVCMGVNQIKSDLETVLFLCKSILDNYSSANARKWKH